jgi:hypothetical protein
MTPVKSGYPPPLTATWPVGYVAPPTPKPLPTNTPGPSPTRPPTATPIPSLTPTSLPTVLPPVLSADPAHLPVLTHDLLFLEVGQLKRWNRATGQIEILLGPSVAGTFAGSVLAFSVSEQGRNAAAVIVPEDGGSQIVLLSLDTRQTLSLVDQVGALLDMSISPDGQSVVYIPQDPLPDPALSATPPPLTPVPRVAALNSAPALVRSIGGLKRAALAQQPRAGGGPGSGKVFVVRADAANQPREIGYCAEVVLPPDYQLGCRGLVWSPDSHSLVGGDGQGIWLSDLEAPAHLLVANYIGPPDTRGLFSYVPISWSPMGRYVLVSVRYSEGRSRALLDAQAGHLADVPNSNEYIGPSALITWLQDGRLFIFRPRDEQGEFNMTGEIWRVDPALPELLSRESVLPLELPKENYPAALEQLQDGRLAFGMLNASSSDYLGRGLYFVAINANRPSKQIGLPPNDETSDHDFYLEILWAPDGSGAIVRDFYNNLLIYAAIDSSALYDLRPIFDLQPHDGIPPVCCFAWVQ